MRIQNGFHRIEIRLDKLQRVMGDVKVNIQNLDQRILQLSEFKHLQCSNQRKIQELIESLNTQLSKSLNTSYVQLSKSLNTSYAQLSKSLNTSYAQLSKSLNTSNAATERKIQQLTENIASFDSWRREKVLSDDQITRMVETVFPSVLKTELPVKLWPTGHPDQAIDTESRCTAFPVYRSSRGLVLATARHCLHPADTEGQVIRIDQNRSAVVHIADAQIPFLPLVESKVADVALLLIIEGAGTEHLMILPLQIDHSHGQRVVAMGFPNVYGPGGLNVGRGHVIVQGIISQPSPAPRSDAVDDQLVLADVDVLKGMSGGYPVFNLRNQVIGVQSASGVGPSVVALVQPSRHIQRCIDTLRFGGTC